MARDALLHHLLAHGYVRVPLVENEGEFALRGSLIDCYPPGVVHPIRIEFYADTVESIREFLVATQRTARKLPEAFIWPNHSIEDEETGTHLLQLLE